MTLISGVWIIHDDPLFPGGVHIYVWDDLLDYAPTVLHPLFDWDTDVYRTTDVGGVTQLEYLPLAQVKRMVLDGPCGCGDEVRDGTQ